MVRKVYLLDLDSTTGQWVRTALGGVQLGEYFGASVLAVNVNGDGLDELLVGAPTFSLRPASPLSSGDEGKVYVYVNDHVRP